MKEQIEFIRAKCIEANPSIKDLVNGCFIKVSWIDDSEPELIEWTDRTGMRENGLNSIIEDNVSGEIVEILGRDIRLADVLLAIKDRVVKTDYLSRTYEEIQDLTYNIIIRWNLKQDRLEDQSPETIEFIYNLLK